jgi:hypothetical protein
MPKRVRSKTTRRKSSQVPGQYLGFSLQATRVLVRLLEAREADWCVSLECFDDVGVETPAGLTIAEQTKSTHGKNPVDDRAPDLWKTFANWLDAIECGDLQLGKTTFEIYVSQPKVGRIVSSFSAANTADEAQSAIASAKRALWGEAPAFPRKDRVPKNIADYVSRVFDADESKLTQVVQSFTYSCGTGSPQDDLKSLFSKALIPTESIEDVIKYAMGWVKEKTDILLEKGKPAIVSVNEFRLSVVSFVTRLNYRRILTTFARDPSPSEIQSNLDLRTYVRQLELIESDDIDKIRAVTDYLKASSDRTQWSKKGLVHDSSFDEFEEGLVRTWSNLKRKVDIQVATSDAVKRGSYLYSECSEHIAKLEGLEVPRHFTPGCFYALADTKSVGWHPDYKSKLKSRQGTVP